MNSKFKVLLYEQIHAEGVKVLREKCNLVYANSLEENALITRVKDVDAIIIRVHGAITRTLIESAKNLKVIGRHGAGLNHIDLKAAKEHGVRVVYRPEATSRSVAEHFVCLALMLAKKMREADSVVRRRDWNSREKLISTELFGKTLGIVGFGRIGKQIARICSKGFGMPVIYHRHTPISEAEKDLNARGVHLKQLFQEADFISINLPLTSETRGLVNADLMRLMKPNAILINTSRGAVWNEADLFRALREQWFAGAGSDVFEEEPTNPDNPLFTLQNFIGTPHTAAHTEEGLIRMSLVARDVLAVLEGRRPEFPVPEQLFRNK